MPDRQKYIYFIQAGNGGPIKIGTAYDVQQRRDTLQTGNPNELRILCAFPGSEAGERKFHKHFEEERLSGEWFKPTGRVMQVVRSQIALALSGDKCCPDCGKAATPLQIIMDDLIRIQQSQGA